MLNAGSFAATVGHRSCLTLAMVQARGIALFPGGFKPAHRDHLLAIADLCARPEIDEVRVIVSDRARLLPGTHLALGGHDCADALRLLLSICPQSKPVSVHLAPHKAIDYAYDMIDSAPSGCTLWFCVGQADVQNGDARFERLTMHPDRERIRLRVLVLPSSKQPVHATELRSFLARGLDSSVAAEFLPVSLTQEEGDNYWSRLRASVQPMANLLLPKITGLLAQSSLPRIKVLEPIEADAVDPCFRLTTEAGEVYAVHYAGDTVASGSFVRASQPLPARRLVVQARILRHLKKLKSSGRWQLAQIRLWDKHHRLLVFTELPGRRLDSALLGQMPPETAGGVMEVAAEFLASFHAISAIDEPLWGGQEDEQHHWHECSASLLPSSSGQALLRPRVSLVHLNFSPASFQYDGSRLYAGGLERSALYGDPALDLASFIQACEADHCQPVLINRFLSRYEQISTALGLLEDDPNRCRRALSLAEQVSIASCPKTST